MKRETIDRIAVILTKVLEVGYWVGTGLMFAIAIVAQVNPDWLGFLMNFKEFETLRMIDVMGFSMILPAMEFGAEMQALSIYAVGGALIMGLTAMIFRNLNLIIKRSQASTPFQKDNIRMLREIGYFTIGIPVTGLIFTIIMRIVMGTGADCPEMSVNWSGIVYAIVMFCLTGYFARGMELEKEVDGLV